MEHLKAAEVADEILSLYTRYGSEDYIGESVSQIEHMCQCAQLAQEGNYDDEVILASFFHDIGHLCEHIMDVEYMDDFGIVDHEKIGADYLSAKGFSERITKLVASHVDAKRYLTYKKPGYYDKLSEASKRTLGLQGGRMTEDEARNFECEALYQLYVALRGWDDMAKQERVPLPDLERYRRLMIAHLIKK